MALDSKQKRGSVIGLSLPYRQWTAEPDGTVDVTARLSLLKLGSAVTPSAPPSFLALWARNSNIVIGVAR